MHGQQSHITLGVDDKHSEPVGVAVICTGQSSGLLAGMGL